MLYSWYPQISVLMPSLGMTKNVSYPTVYMCQFFDSINRIIFIESICLGAILRSVLALLSLMFIGVGWNRSWRPSGNHRVGAIGAGLLLSEASTLAHGTSSPAQAEDF